MPAILPNYWTANSADRPDNTLFSKKISWTFVCFLILFLPVVGACAASAHAMVAAGVIDAPPYSYVDKSGRPAGLHVEIARMIAAKENIDLEIKLMEWPQAIESVENGGADFLLTALQADHRLWQFAFSNPHSSMELVLFTRSPSAAASIPDISGLPSITIGIPDVIADWQSFNFLPPQAKAVIADMDSLFQKLAIKQIDAILCPREAGLAVLRKDTHLQGISARPYPVLSRKICFAARAEEAWVLQKLNHSLDSIRYSREYSRLIQNNVNSIDKLESTGIPVIHLIFPVLFTLILLTGYFITTGTRMHIGKLSLKILFAVCLSTEAVFVCTAYLYDKHANSKRVYEQQQTLVDLNTMLFSTRIQRVKEALMLLNIDPLFTSNAILSSEATVSGIRSDDDQIGGQTVYAQRRRLDRLTQGWRRSEAMLIDTSGIIFLSSNPMNDGTRIDQPPPVGSAQAASALGGVSFDIYKSSDSTELMFQFSVALSGWRPGSNRPEPVGWVVVRVPMEEFLIPLQWELRTMGATGEILAFYKDSDRYVCANNARLVPDPPSRLSFSAAAPEGMGKLIASAFEGKTGVATAKDYRQVNVIASYHPVMDEFSHVFLAIIVKQDEFEALAYPRKTLLYNLFLFAFFSFAVFILGFLGFWSITRRIRSLGELTQELSVSGSEPNSVIEGNDSIAHIAQSIKEMNHSWQKRLSAAEHLSELGQLSARLAHEIRTPLTSINVILQSLEMRLLLDTDQKEDFFMINKEIKRLDGVVTSFLKFARPGASKMERFDLSKLLRFVATLLHARIDKEAYLIHLALPDIPLLITGDESQLLRVFLNLYSNAVEAMPNGGVVSIGAIKIVRGSPEWLKVAASDSLENMETLDSVVEVTVTDSGPGISEAILTEVFQPFFTTKNGGTGLGLAIAFSLVKRHNGAISIENIKEGGCVCRVWLPS